MARIRTIKPELPHSETLGTVSRDARLLFVNLFTIADDSGRARASSRLLASLLYPFDDDAPKLMDGWLGELAGIGAIRLYAVDGTAYLDIPKWLEHQKIDRPSASRLPEYSTDTREPSRALDALPRTLDLGPTPIVPKGTSYPHDFESFWTLYPNKVGKDAAFSAWKKRKKSGDLPSQEVLVEAIGQYINAKPADRAYCNPSTWLNQGRWLDALSPTAAPAVTTNPTKALTDDEWRSALRRFRADSKWPGVGYGPQPGYGGCVVPTKILAEFNLESRAA
jgi:hypothetical protein